MQRDAGRPPVPRQKSEEKIEEQPLLSNHPFVDRVILIQALPDKYIYFLLFTILHANEGISQWIFVVLFPACIICLFIHSSIPLSDGGPGYFSVTDYLWSSLDMQYASDACHQRISHGHTDTSPVSQHVIVYSLWLHATVVNEKNKKFILNRWYYGHLSQVYLCHCFSSLWVIVWETTQENLQSSILTYHALSLICFMLYDMELAFFTPFFNFFIFLQGFIFPPVFFWIIIIEMLVWALSTLASS